MKKLKVLDLFSGIGGFSLGLERTGGFTTIAFCENDIHCQKVLKKHWPKVPIFNDIRKIKVYPGKKRYCTLNENNETGIGNTIDVLCGGFPCTDISTANVNGLGLKGENSGLWTEYARLIKEVKPRYAIIENVANLRAKGLAQVLKDLWTLGYSCEWHIISACSIGAIHRRERIFIIAYSQSNRNRRNSSSVGKKISYTKEQKVWSELDGKNENNRGNRKCGKRKSKKLLQPTPNPDRFRLWRAFATEEKRREWWSKATASFRPMFKKVSKIKPTICRGNDGISAQLDKVRRIRVKQLGNAVLPQIIEVIGNSILNWERRQLKSFLN